MRAAELIDDFDFRTATPFFYVPAEIPVPIGVAPGNSTSSADVIATFPALPSVVKITWPDHRVFLPVSYDTYNVLYTQTAQPTHPPATMRPAPEQKATATPDPALLIRLFLPILNPSPCPPGFVFTKEGVCMQ
jgi:hypothetical protein